MTGNGRHLARPSLFRANGGPRLVIEHVRSWEWESFARREPRRARERLGPLNPTTRQPKS